MKVIRLSHRNRIDLSDSELLAMRLLLERGCYALRSGPFLALNERMMVAALPYAVRQALKDKAFTDIDNALPINVDRRKKKTA